MLDKAPNQKVSDLLNVLDETLSLVTWSVPSISFRRIAIGGTS